VIQLLEFVGLASEVIRPRKRLSSEPKSDTVV